MIIEEAIENVEQILGNQSLNKVQEIVFRQAWEGKSYAEIARSIDYDPEYIKQVGFELWRSLSLKTRKKITKNNFQSILKRQLAVTTAISLDPNKLGQSDRPSIRSEFKNAIAQPKSTLTFTTFSHQDWGDALDVSDFFGRYAELLNLEQWLVGDRCRLLTILGREGIGKTALCAKAAERIQEHFDYIIWRSLRNAPPIEKLLTVLIKFISNNRDMDLLESIDEQICLLLNYLRSSRCLIVLDNTESILQNDEFSGQYRAGYEGYGQLFRCIAETHHQSCLMLTSREKLKWLQAKEGKQSSVRSLLLEF
jgi:hypothetical protein